MCVHPSCSLKTGDKEKEIKGGKNIGRIKLQNLNYEYGVKERGISLCVFT